MCVCIVSYETYILIARLHKKSDVRQTKLGRDNKNLSEEEKADAY